jgi:hypothetical protein
MGFNYNFFTKSADKERAADRESKYKIAPSLKDKEVILGYLREKGESNVMSVAWDLFKQIHLASGEVGICLMELEAEGKVEFVNGKYGLKEKTT